jgi:hypothetical protein
MDAFAAIILICATTVAAPDCNETNALDVLSRTVHSELACTMGWQEVIARSNLQDGLGDTYLKTLCRRVRSERDAK